jgi:protein-arginine deiminase
VDQRFAYVALTSLLLVAMGIGCGEEDTVFLSEDGAGERTIRFVGYTGDPPEVDVEALVVVDGARTGVVDLDDPLDVEHRFDPADGFGALFLANLDDDAGRCTTGADDESLWHCSDADLDEIVNEEDLLDMARIRTAPVDVDGLEVVGRLVVDEGSLDRVRLYLRTGSGDSYQDFELYESGDEISGELIAEGLDFAMEGLGLIEDREVWDGRVELTWQVEVEGQEEVLEDRAHLQQAPVLLRHHLDPARIVFAATLGQENLAFRQDLVSAIEEAEVPDGYQWFNVWDPWTQDHFENGYMSVPGPDGQRVIQVYFRSGNLNYPGGLEEVVRRAYQLSGQSMPPALREAGAVVHTQLRGPGTTGVVAFNRDRGFEPPSLDGLDVDDVARYLVGASSNQTYPAVSTHYDRVMEWDTLDSMGNTETIPPHVSPSGEAYPNGRIIRGDGPGAFIRPDTHLSQVFNAQGQQEIVWVDTSWLLVAHVDETISFLETPTDRGWSVLVADPAGAVEIFEDLEAQGHGDAVLFEGKFYPDWSCWNCPDIPAQTTVSQTLNDSNVMGASARSIVEVAAQIDVLRDEVGIDDDDLVDIPFLMDDLGAGLAAYQPGIVNGISLRPDFFGPPKPHGPVIEGEDVFEATVNHILGELGIEVYWIENWDVYHVGIGEVHCASNVERVVPETPWWSKEVSQ